MPARAISPAQRTVLGALIDAHPRAAAHGFIYRRLWPIEADEPEHPQKVVRVHVHRLRRRLPDNAIRVLWATGYRLEEHAVMAAVDLAGERDARDVEAG